MKRILFFILILFSMQVFSQIKISELNPTVTARDSQYFIIAWDSAGIKVNRKISFYQIEKAIKDSLKKESNTFTGANTFSSTTTMNGNTHLNGLTTIPENYVSEAYNNQVYAKGGYLYIDFNGSLAFDSIWNVNRAKAYLSSILSSYATINYVDTKDTGKINTTGGANDLFGNYYLKGANIVATEGGFIMPIQNISTLTIKGSMYLDANTGRIKYRYTGGPYPEEEQLLWMADKTELQQMITDIDSIIHDLYILKRLLVKDTIYCHSTLKLLSENNRIETNSKIVPTNNFDLGETGARFGTAFLTSLNMSSTVSSPTAESYVEPRYAIGDQNNRTILAAPSTWLMITVDGNHYKIPLFSP